MGQGLVEHQWAEEALLFLNRAIAIARSNPNCGFPKVAWTGKVAALIQLGRLAEARALVSEGLDYARKHEEKAGMQCLQMRFLYPGGYLYRPPRNIREQSYECTG